MTHSSTVLTHPQYLFGTHSVTALNQSLYSLTMLTHPQYTQYSLSVITPSQHSPTRGTHSLTITLHSRYSQYSHTQSLCTHGIPSYTITLSHAGAYHPSLTLPASSTKSGDLIHLVSHFSCSTGDVSTGTTHAALSKGSARLTWMTKFFQ